MPVNPDVIIAKANELKVAQERVAELEAELKALIAYDDGYAPQYARLSTLKDLLDDASLTDKIVALLEHSPDRPFHFKEIFKTIGGNEGSVRSTIAKLIGDGKIRRLDWGKYQALPKKEERPKAD